MLIFLLLPYILFLPLLLITCSASSRTFQCATVASHESRQSHAGQLSPTLSSSLLDDLVVFDQTLILLSCVETKHESYSPSIRCARVKLQAFWCVCRTEPTPRAHIPTVNHPPHTFHPYDISSSFETHTFCAALTSSFLPCCCCCCCCSV